MRARTWPALAIACAALACTGLAGCGQTGILYLPPVDGEIVSKGPDATTTTPATDPAAEAEAARKREQTPAPNPAPK
jgi:predicted small lipoprotein YifL